MGDRRLDGLQSDRRRRAQYVSLSIFVESRDFLGHSIGLSSISLGISPTDGTLHLGFDQHDNPLRYRVSNPGVALRPNEVEWNAKVFGEVLVNSSQCFSNTRY